MQQSKSDDTLTLLRDSAEGFVKGSTDFKALRARRGNEPGYDPATCRQMAELGWFGILVPEDCGGLGLGFAEMSCVLQALGKGLLADPLLPSAVLAARVLSHAPDSALRSRLLTGLAAATSLPAVAWQEEPGRIDPCQIGLRASRDGTGFRLSGRKRFVAGAAGAQGFIVSARVGDEFALFWVPADAPGMVVRQEWRADETPSGLVELDNVRVDEAAVLVAPSARGLDGLGRALDEAAVMAAAEMFGVMQCALQMALGYMRTRVQFGKPIGSFQALQHKAADLYVIQELSRAVLDEAVAVLDRSVGARERALIASRCKARCSDVGLRITREVIQLHGAIGYTDEYDAGLFLKRALVLSAWLGNASQHRQRFAALTAQAEADADADISANPTASGDRAAATAS